MGKLAIFTAKQSFHSCRQQKASCVTRFAFLTYFT